MLAIDGDAMPGSPEARWDLIGLYAGQPALEPNGNDLLSLYREFREDDDRNAGSVTILGFVVQALCAEVVALRSALAH
jgi:hypothetical protein